MPLRIEERGRIMEGRCPYLFEYAKKSIFQKCIFLLHKEAKVIR